MELKFTIAYPMVYIIVIAIVGFLTPRLAMTGIVIMNNSFVTIRKGYVEML